MAATAAVCVQTQCYLRSYQQRTLHCGLAGKAGAGLRSPRALFGPESGPLVASQDSNDGMGSGAGLESFRLDAALRPCRHRHRCRREGAEKASEGVRKCVRCRRTTD